MLTTVTGDFYKTPNRSWDMNKKLDRWEMGGGSELAASLNSETMHRVSLSSSFSLLQTGEMFESEKDDSSLKTCHDREARKMAEQRMVREAKSRWQQPAGKDGGELTRYVDNFSASRKMERDLCGDGRSGNHCERKDKYVEHMLGKCKTRNGTVKYG